MDSPETLDEYRYQYGPLTQRFLIRSFCQEAWLETNKKKRGAAPKAEAAGKAEEQPEPGQTRVSSYLVPASQQLTDTYTLELDGVTRCHKLTDGNGRSTWCSQPNEVCALVRHSGDVWVKYVASDLIVKCSTILDGRPGSSSGGALSRELGQPAGAVTAAAALSICLCLC